VVPYDIINISYHIIQEVPIHRHQWPGHPGAVSTRSWVWPCFSGEREGPWAVNRFLQRWPGFPLSGVTQFGSFNVAVGNHLFLIGKASIIIKIIYRSIDGPGSPFSIAMFKKRYGNCHKKILKETIGIWPENRETVPYGVGVRAIYWMHVALHSPSMEYIHIHIIYTVMTFKYVEGGPDREAPQVVWNTSSYIWM
jgi:hypothetical protein